MSRHDRIVTLSRDMLEYYASLGLKRSNLVYVYNSRNIESADTPVIPAADIEAIRAVKANRTLIGVSASLTARKGFHQLIHLLASRTDLALVIIGSGPEQERLAQLANDLKVSDRVLLTGYRIDAQRYFGLFDIYAMTSYSEGFPLVLIEAAVHKCRIVCSDTPLFRELFTDREVAFFALDDIPSLSLAVDHALNINDIHIRFAEVMATKYSMDAMIGNYMKVYDDAINE